MRCVTYSRLSAQDETQGPLSKFFLLPIRTPFFEGIWTEMIEGSVGDIQIGPKSDILGQSNAGIRTNRCLDFLAREQRERDRGETNFRIKTTLFYTF